MKLQELETILLEHCYEMSILKRDAYIKKKEVILDSLISAIVRSKTSYLDVVKCINDVNKDEVIDLSFFDNGGNIDKYIKDKWIKFAKALWRQRSVGLGTPNAASGEGELMFIFLSPNITKPKKGDLLINGDKIELKGEGVRVNGKISGKELRKRTLEVCSKFNLTPNRANRTKLDAVELEKVQHLDYWKKQLNKLTTNEQKVFVSEWLSCIDDKSHETDTIFINGEFNHKNFLKEIVKSLYLSMINDGNFDKFVILGDGTDTKIIGGNITEFNNKIDNEDIIILKDYFRINQNNYIGWYIK